MHESTSTSAPNRPRTLLRCVQATIALGSILVIALAVRWAGQDRRPTVTETRSSMVTGDTARPSEEHPSYDLALYEAEVRRMRAGESYYDAAADELPRRGYPAKSVFNWRQPLLSALIAALPRPDDARLLLGVLGAVILLLGFGEVRRNPEFSPAAWIWVVLTALSLIPGIMPRLYYSSELWAGNLILLSLLLASSGRGVPAAIVGIAAVFVRELAVPYCLTALAVAWMRGRRREFVAWSVGLFLWAIYFAWHATQVIHHIPPQAVASRGWLCGGGIDFVLSTARMHFLLVLLPRWFTVLYFGLATLGFVGCKSELGQRGAATYAAYVAFFALVGQPFNQYWGQIWVPLLCLGVARSFAAARRFGGTLLSQMLHVPEFLRRFRKTRRSVSPGM